MSAAFRNKSLQSSKTGVLTTTDFIIEFLLRQFNMLDNVLLQSFQCFVTKGFYLIKSYNELTKENVRMTFIRCLTEIR